MYDNERYAHTRFPNTASRMNFIRSQSVLHARRVIYIKGIKLVLPPGNTVFAMETNENIDEMPIKWHIVRGTLKWLLDGSVHYDDSMIPCRTLLFHGDIPAKTVQKPSEIHAHQRRRQRE